MARKIKQTWVQGRIFDDDEIINIRKKPKRYNDYVQGARDMFLAFMAAEDHERESIKHLPKGQMQALVTESLKNKVFLKRFLMGDKITFDIEKNEDGNVISVSPILHKKNNLSAEAQGVINTCLYLLPESIEKSLRLNRAYIVNEIREYYREFNLTKLSNVIYQSLRNEYNDQS